MFDILDPAGSLGQKYLNIPKGGVQSTEDPQSYAEMIGNRIPGSQGGSMSNDFMHQAVPGGGADSYEQQQKKRAAALQGISDQAAAQKRQQDALSYYNPNPQGNARPNGMKKGGAVKAKSKPKASKPKVSSASKRADGCCIKGKTRGRLV
jgi:hypothetical protein